jgi:hypothetical protein
LFHSEIRPVGAELFHSEIRPVGAEKFHSEGRTDKQKWLH